MGPAGFEPATWRITALFQLGYMSMLLSRFMLDWGLTLEEINLVFDKHFVEYKNNYEIDEINIVLNRVFYNLGDSSELHEKLIIQMVALFSFPNEFIDYEANEIHFTGLRFLANQFNFEDDKYEFLVNKGLELSTGLYRLVQTCIRANES